MKLINCFGNTAKRNDCCNTAEKEWSRQEQIDYTTEYIQKTFVDKGMCADWSIHDKGDGNPHVHLLVTMRPFNSDHSWGNKEIKDWEFVRDENGNIVVDESHPDWWQDKKDPDRHGIRIPVLDENGVQKVGTRNRKQWKRVLTDATGWNNPKNCELWRSEWANVCNAHLKVENHIDHRSYATQGKFEIPTIHEGADARKIDEKFQNGQTSSASWKVEENQIMQRLRERRAGGRTFADDRTDAGRMGILFTITGLLIVGIGYQVGKIYRKYCWDILSIIVAITSTAIVIYFGEWIKNAIPINLMVFLLLSHVIYIYFHANIYYHISMKGESI